MYSYNYRNSWNLEGVQILNMKNNLHIKKTIISKESLIMYMLMIFEVILLFKLHENLSFYDDFEYTYVGNLFSFGIIIMEFLLFISVYINYKNYYSIIRYINISKFKKIVIKDIIKLTLFFVCMFNIIIFIVMYTKFDGLNQYINYFVLTLLLQSLAFLGLAYLYIIIYFNSCSIRKSVIIVFLGYMILSNITNIDFIKYFMLSINYNNGEILNIFKNLISIHIILIIYFINTMNKGIKIYDKKL